MAKSDFPFMPFPWIVPSASAPSGGLAVDLETVFKWYWRVRKWTATMSGSFTVVVAATESGWYGSTGSSTVTLEVGLSVVETFAVLADGLDELSLVLSRDPPYENQQYQWLATGSPIVSGAVNVIDSLGYGYQPAALSFAPGSSPRTMFSPARSNPPYDDGWRHMTRDPSSGLFTPFLGDSGSLGDGGPLWLGGSWGQIIAITGNPIVPTGGGPNGGLDLGSMVICIQSTPVLVGGDFYGSEAVAASGSVDGQLFSAGGFVEWSGINGAPDTEGDGGTREPTGVTYPGGGSISLTLTPLEYWTYAPRIDPGNPTYDPGTGAIVNNPATGVPWTLQEIISRQGP